jgi:CubicO group peptidase (beta-lactamase class C family)
MLTSAAIALVISTITLADAPSIEHVEPASVGFDAAKLAEIDKVIDAALAEKKLPGCVVCIGRRGKIVLLKAYGDRSVEPDRTPMMTDTLFDLASLTKPIATATSVVLLVEQEKLTVDAPVATYWPEFAANGKEQVTIEQQLVHTSGLIPDNALADYADGPRRAFDRIANLKLQFAPGERFAYSDVGFLALGHLVERVSGENLHEFSRKRVFQPLGMKETGFLPAEELRRRAAPTEQRDGHWMIGEVHDPRAFALGGIAGHAGLFSTAEDLAIYASLMLGRGEFSDARVLRDDTWQRFVAPRSVPVPPAAVGLRTLGWDMRTGYSINRGEGMSSAAFGHGGFTGTGIWIDPERDLFIIFLSNRVHPHGKGNVNPLIGRIGTIAVSALTGDR